jgi:hypothetical protein
LLPARFGLLLQAGSILIYPPGGSVWPIIVLIDLQMLSVVFKWVASIIHAQIVQTATCYSDLYEADSGVFRLVG